MLTLTATAVGFHTTSPLGLPMAPAAFLRSPTNIEGTILFEPATGRWITAESLRHPSHTIEITASQPEGTGFRTDITISEITWLRTDATGTHVIGTLALDLTLTAEHQESRPGTTWELDLADALEDIVQAEGFRFLGAAGDDILIPSAPILPIYGRVEMHGRGGDDHLTGSLADDFLFGGTGDDVLTDISGTNRLRGGAGDDRLELGLWSDGSIAWGGLGHDILTSSNGSDRLLGGRGHDRIEAGRGADILIGNAGNDALSGGDGADRLTGGRGNDRLT
ncbi:MAG: calcium-binding protein, partial [Pseudomonadota bacterium]